MSKRPKDSDFYQQRLRAWQPILTPKWVVATFLIVGAVFIPLGFVLRGASDSVVEYKKQYDGEGTAAAMAPCQVLEANQGATCDISFDVETEMAAPVYVYYELHNFYQNHRRYVKSRDDSQLDGQVQPESSLSDCDPLITNATSGKVLHPCGLIANSYFNDVISCRTATMSETDIAWKSDRESKFKAVPLSVQQENAATTQFIHETYPSISAEAGVTDEHFIVWMRTAALPTFRKLYGRIDSTIPAGTTLSFNLTTNFVVNSFAGKKYLVVSTTSWLGGKNPFLGFAYMVVGGVCVLLALVFFLKNLTSGRKLGDPRFMSWNPN